MKENKQQIVKTVKKPSYEPVTVQVNEIAPRGGALRQRRPITFRREGTSVLQGILKCRGL